MVKYVYKKGVGYWIIHCQNNYHLWDVREQIVPQL